MIGLESPVLTDTGNRALGARPESGGGTWHQAGDLRHVGAEPAVVVVMEPGHTPLAPADLSRPKAVGCALKALHQTP